MGVGINKLKKPGDLAFNYRYAYLGRNVMPSQLPDSDVVTAQQMHWIGFTYRFYQSTDINIMALIPRETDGDKDTDQIIGRVNVTTHF